MSPGTLGLCNRPYFVSHFSSFGILLLEEVCGGFSGFGPNIKIFVCHVVSY